MMLLTTCAACAKPLGQDAPAHCVNCRTRYCGDRCLRYHAHRGGHDENCDEIASGGGAEQHHANKKYEEAAAEAVEECAEDTEGQTCYICLEDGSEEGLVRMCACRGAAGFAHLSCLVRQAEILVAEAEENNLGDEAFDAKWARWTKCGLCEQNHYGYVACALGWACWKTYCGRPETDETRMDAMTVLGNGLYAAKNYVDTLSVREADLSMRRRLGASEEDLLVVQSNLAITYGDGDHVSGARTETTYLSSSWCEGSFLDAEANEPRKHAAGLLLSRSSGSRAALRRRRGLAPRSGLRRAPHHASSSSAASATHDFSSVWKGGVSVASRRAFRGEDDAASLTLGARRGRGGSDVGYARAIWSGWLPYTSSASRELAS